MRYVCRLLLLAVGLVAAGCASDRATWSLAHSYMSPRARQLPRAEIEEIVRLVSNSWSDTIIAVGQACGEGPEQMHVVARYTDYEVMVFDLKKRSGHWYIYDHGEGTPTLSATWYGC